MKLSYRLLLPASMAVITLAGCSNVDDTPVVADGSPIFTATIDGLPSRALNNSWEAGDEIGISGCNRNNVCHYSADGQGIFTVKKAEEQIYFTSDSEVDFTAYYPYLAEAQSTLTADTKDQANQKKFDYLWAKASGKKSEPEVVFNFSHRMTKLVLTIKPGTGMSLDELKAATLSLEGFSHSGSFNIATGATTPGAVSEAWTFSHLATVNNADGNLTYSFILFPQTFTKPLEFKALLGVSGGSNYTLRADIDFTAANREQDTSARNEWVAGRQYNLSLILNKTGVILETCLINPWTSVSGDDIIVD